MNAGSSVPDTYPVSCWCSKVLHLLRDHLSTLASDSRLARCLCRRDKQAQPPAAGPHRLLAGPAGAVAGADRGLLRHAQQRVLCRGAGLQGLCRPIPGEIPGPRGHMFEIQLALRSETG